MKRIFKSLVAVGMLFASLGMSGCTSESSSGANVDSITTNSVSKYTESSTKNARKRLAINNTSSSSSNETSSSSSAKVDVGINYALIQTSPSEVTFTVKLDNPYAYTINKLKVSSDDTTLKIYNSAISDYQTLEELSYIINWNGGISAVESQYQMVASTTDIASFKVDEVMVNNKWQTSSGNNEMKIYNIEDYAPTINYNYRLAGFDMSSADYYDEYDNSTYKYKTSFSFSYNSDYIKNLKLSDTTDSSISEDNNGNFLIYTLATKAPNAVTINYDYYYNENTKLNWSSTYEISNFSSSNFYSICWMGGESNSIMFYYINKAHNISSKDKFYDMDKFSLYDLSNNEINFEFDETNKCYKPLNNIKLSTGTFKYYYTKQLFLKVILTNFYYLELYPYTYRIDYSIIIQF